MLRPFARSLKPCANGRSIVGCYMPRPFAHPVACCCANVVACCCAKFETGQSFQPTTPNISFVLWSPKRSATIHTYFIVTSPKGLDPFALPTLLGPARSLRMDYKDLWVVFFPRRTAGPKLVGTYCIRLHTTANTHSTTPNIVGATMFARSLRDSWYDQLQTELDQS